MARTPLFAALQRLAAEHQAADAAGIPVDEYRGWALTRRSALLLLGAGPPGRRTRHRPSRR